MAQRISLTKPSSISHAIGSGRLRARSGSRGKNLVILGAGQSNIANWSSATFHSSGSTQLLTTLNAKNSGGSNSFINSGDGSSYLSRKAYNAANIRFGGALEAGDYWVDDTGGSPAAGQRLLDALTDITNAGKSNSDITNILWSQGESDGSEIYLNNITPTEYYNLLVWLKDYCFNRFSNLKSFMIRPIGRRSSGTTSSYDAIRAAQQSLANNFPSQVIYGSETYDLTLLQETYVDDAVHRSEASYTTEGKRAAFEILASQGIYTSTNTGPLISSVNYNGATITVTVQHDAGTSLANRAGTAYSGSPITITPSSGTGIFTLSDASGNDIPLNSVQITGTHTITITPSVTLIASGNILKYAYGSMIGVDVNSIIYDNHAENPLPLRANYNATINGSLSYLEGMSNLVSFFSPEASYNAAGTTSDAVVWTKRAGSASSARKDDTKPAPSYVSNISTVITGAPAVAGWVFDGTASQKLLVEHALTTSSNYTVFLACTPNTNLTDTTTSVSSNGILTTAATAGTGTTGHFSFRQTAATLSSLAIYAGDNGRSMTNSYANTTVVMTSRNNAGTVSLWENNVSRTGITLSASLIETDGGIPVYAIGNVVDKTNGNDAAQTFIGAIHYIILFNTALSDAQIAQINLSIMNAA